MIFEAVNYAHLVQDFVCSAGAGFGVAFVGQLLSSVLPCGKKGVFVRDVAVSFLFALTIFSYVISFTNYPVVRIYHLIGGAAGFFAFPVKFSVFFHKISKKIFNIPKNKMLCLYGKIKSTVCDKTQKTVKNNEEGQNALQNDHLKSEDVLIYNL